MHVTFCSPQRGALTGRNTTFPLPFGLGMNRPEEKRVLSCADNSSHLRGLLFESLLPRQDNDDGH